MSGGFAHAGPGSTTNGQLAGGLVAQSAGSASSSSSLTQRVSDFVEKNRRALLIAAGAGVVVAGGAAGYYYFNRPGPGAGGRGQKKQQQQQLGGDDVGSPGTGEEAGAAGKRKSKKKKSKKSTGTSAQSSATPGSAKVEQDGDSEGSSDADALSLSTAQLAALPIEKRKQIAGDLKTKGNKAYSAKKYKEAIDIYSKAIECDEQAVYYSNRAACYTNLSKNEEVVKDCSEALRLDPTYVKALNRRGQAREAMASDEDLFLALCDFTAGAIIDGFQNESMAKSVDRVMKQYASEKGSKIMSEREPRLPSPTFIKAYMEAFRPRDRPTKPDSPSQGEETLFLAFDALDARDYTHAFTLFNEAIEQGINSNELKGRALNMSGTFKFIIGDAPGALEALEESTKLCPDFTQTWVKKASVYMELARPEQAFESFEKAIQVNDKDPDIYYHRGQVYFITGQFNAAIEEYKRSTELDSTFVFSQIQLAVAMYKNEQAERALHLFKKIIREFGNDSPEIYNYYGEILLDRGEFTSALENLDKAISLEKAKGSSTSTPVNVLPMVNKALCLYQSRQALGEAETICREALELDPTCDIAVATLGQLLLQQNKVKEAVKAFEKSAEIARTEPELVNALAYEAATKAQLDFIEKYPEYAHKLGLAQSRM